MDEYCNIGVKDMLYDYKDSDYSIEFLFNCFSTILETEDGECNLVYNCSNNYKSFTINLLDEVDLSDFEDLFVLCTNDKGTFYCANEIDEEYSFFGEYTAFFKHLKEYDLDYLIEDCYYEIDDENKVIKLTYNKAVHD